MLFPGEEEAQVRFARMMDDVKYFGRHPKEAMQFHAGWPSLASRLAVIASTSHDMQETINARAEWEGMFRPSKDRLASDADKEEHWDKWFLPTPDHAARCSLCGKLERKYWEYRLRGTRIYSCEACVKRPNKRALVIQYCIVHPEAIPAAVGGAPL